MPGISLLHVRLRGLGWRRSLCCRLDADQFHWPYCQPTPVAESMQVVPKLLTLLLEQELCTTVVRQSAFLGLRDYSLRCLQDQDHLNITCRFQQPQGSMSCTNSNRATRGCRPGLESEDFSHACLQTGLAILKETLDPCSHASEDSSLCLSVPWLLLSPSTKAGEGSSV